MNDAIYSVKTSDKDSVGHPLIEGGQKLLPSVTRVFSASREMYVYLEAYERSATSTEPLEAFVTFFKGQDKVSETPVHITSNGMNPRTKAVPLRLTIPLNGLSPDTYTFQITVLSPTLEKANFWQAPVKIVP